MFKKKVNRTNIIIVQDDIVAYNADAIVNWTTPSLNGGDDTHSRIHQEGGSTIYKDCQRVLANYSAQHEDTGTFPPGDVGITHAGTLPPKIIIHGVVPLHNKNRDSEPDMLKKLYQNLFSAVRYYDQHEDEIRKLALTPVSSQLYGPDNDKEAAEIALDYILNFADNYDIRSIAVVCQDPYYYNLYKQELIDRTTPSLLERLITKLFKV